MFEAQEERCPECDALASPDTGVSRRKFIKAVGGSESLPRCGAAIFGDPSGNQQVCWLYTGHSLTVRCDGNSEPDAAFGGPMYYGHSPDGYSVRNCFNYQTQAVRNLFDALSGDQRTRALLVVTPQEPNELLPSVRFRAEHPGLPVRDLTADQRALVETVMRTILNPYRRE